MKKSLFEALSNVDNFKHVTNSKLRDALEVIAPHQKKYDGDHSIVDPNGLQVSTKPIPVICDEISILSAKMGDKPNKIFTLDIETWSFRANVLHFGCLFDGTTGEHKFFRDWDEIVEKIEYDLADKAVQLSISTELQKKHITNIYAHNGSRFDWVGLSQQLLSNTQVDPSCRTDPQKRAAIFNEDGKIRFTKSQLMNYDKRVVPYLRQGIWDSGDENVNMDNTHDDSLKVDTTAKFKEAAPAGAVIRTRKIDFELDGQTTTKKFYFRWGLERLGNRFYIKVSVHKKTPKSGKRALIVTNLLDSLAHLQGSLKDLGAKTKTPLQYTNPIEWLANEKEEGRFDGNEHGEEGRKYWFSVLTEESKEYCLNDCRVLADALTRYRQTFAQATKTPDFKFGIDPLRFVTAAQASKAAMIANSAPATKQMPYSNKFPCAMFGEHGSGRWKLKTFNEKQHIFNQQLQDYGKVNAVNVPLTHIKDSGKVCTKVWYQHKKSSQMYSQVVFGGRTEVFQPMNKPGTRVVCIDVNSMYASIMADNKLSFPDPRFLRKLDKDISGRNDILEHLKKFGGMYRIITKLSTNMLISQRFPVFPVRMSGADTAERLAFPTWSNEEKITLMVTGEELKHFLEMGNVLNDDIKIIGEDSLISTLQPCKNMPFYQFAHRVYKSRKESNDDIEKAILKRIMNAGGYGTLVQVNDTRIKFIEGDAKSNRNLLTQLFSISRDWQGWQDSEFDDDGSMDVLRFAKRWANDHWRASKYLSPTVSQGVKVNMLTIDMPSRLASHAIRALGASITAHARVKLHKGIMSASSLPDVEVLYCDTDSMYMQVPDTKTDTELVQDLTEKGIQISSDKLGAWKIESKKPNVDLLTNDLAKKMQIPPFKLKNKADLTKGDLPNIPRMQALFLAPKIFFLMDEDRNILAEVAKGIPLGESVMRASLSMLVTSMPKLGDARGLMQNIFAEGDLLKSLKDQSRSTRRKYPGLYQQSTPVILKNPSKGVLGSSKMTWAEYENTVISSGIGTGSNKLNGINDAIRFYENSLIKGRLVSIVRTNLKSIFDEIKYEVMMYQDEHGHHMPAHKQQDLMTHYTKIIQEKLDS